MSGLEMMKCPICRTKQHTWRGVVEHQRYHDRMTHVCPECEGTGRDPNLPGVYACMRCGGSGRSKK